MLLSGALGDVNPHHVHRQNNDCRGDGFAEAEQLGRDVAEGSTPCSAKRSRSRRTDPTVVRERDDRRDARLDAADRRTRRPGVPIELVEWAIGPVRLVSVPGEAFHALGRAIEARAAKAHVLVAGLAPEWHGYLPLPFTEATRSR